MQCSRACGMIELRADDRGRQYGVGCDREHFRVGLHEVSRTCGAAFAALFVRAPSFALRHARRAARRGALPTRRDASWGPIGGYVRGARVRTSLTEQIIRPPEQAREGAYPARLAAARPVSIATFAFSSPTRERSPVGLPEEPK